MTPNELVDMLDPQEAQILDHTLVVGIWDQGFWVVPTTCPEGFLCPFFYLLVKHLRPPVNPYQTIPKSFQFFGGGPRFQVGEGRGAKNVFFSQNPF